MAMNRFDDILKPIEDNHYLIWKDQVDVFLLCMGTQTDLLFGYSWKDPLYRMGSVPPDASEDEVQEEIIRLFNERRDEILEKLDASYTRDEGVYR